MKKNLNLINALMSVFFNQSSRIFWRKAGDLEETQRTLLRRIISRNRKTEFGGRYSFPSLKTYEDFRDSVPIRNYDDFRQDIERIRRGEEAVLTSRKVRLLEPTGGTSRGTKLIPYTEDLRKEFMAAVKPWLADLFRTYPDLRKGSSYWSVSPAVTEEMSDSVIPIGFEDDSDYFGPLGRWIRRIYSVPDRVKALRSMDNFRTATALYLLADENLAMISVWNPSFLTLQMQYIEQHKERLLQDLRNGFISWPEPENESTGFAIRADPGRADYLASSVPENYWPRLTLISCWTESMSALSLPDLRLFFPTVPIQGKGLLATEGIVSFPVEDAGGSVLAIRSHFYEFRNEGGKIIPSWELTEDGEYEVILTTGGGLYRYELGDRVRVTGFYRGLPLLSLLGRNAAMDLTGEKLTEPFILSVIQELYGDKPPFCLLAPVKTGDRWTYTLFVEGAAADGSFLDRLLKKNFHYAHSRDLGQLGPADWQPLPPGSKKIFHDFLICKGQKAGDIKDCLLYRDTDIGRCFPEKKAGICT